LLASPGRQTLSARRRAAGIFVDGISRSAPRRRVTVRLRSEQLGSAELEKFPLMSARLAIDAVVHGAQDDNGKIERCHRRRYRQVPVRFQELDVAVVSGDLRPGASLWVL